MGRKRRRSSVIISRAAGFAVSFAMALSLLAALPCGILKTRAAVYSATITTGNFTVSGKIGEYLEQEVVFEIENTSTLDFNEKVLVPGFDLTEFFNYRSEYRYHSNSKNQDCYLYKPVGISCKVIGVDEENGKHLKALVYGTPLSTCYTAFNLHTCPKWFLKGYELGERVTVSISSYPQGKWAISGDAANAKSSVQLSPTVVKGSVGSAVNATVKLTLSNAFFSDYVDKGTDVSDWFPGRGVSDADGRARQLPVGISATLDSDIVPGSTTATIKLSGTPLYKSNNYLVVCVPGKYLTGTNGNGSWFSYYYAESEMTDDCCFDISGSADEPVYAAVDGVRYEVYAGTSISSGTRNYYIDSYYTGGLAKPNYASSIPAAFTVYNNSGVFKDSFKPNSTGVGFYKRQDFDNGIYVGNPLADGKEIGNIPFENLTCAYSAGESFYATGYGMMLQTKSDGSAPFSVLGEYPLVITFDRSYLKNYTGEVGYTPVVETNAKLIVKSPYEFVIENAVISGEPGDAIDTNIVLVPGDASTFDVSEEKLPAVDTKGLEKTGLKATVVSYAEDHIAINLKGRLNPSENPKVLLSDCIKLSADNIKIKDAFKAGDIDVMDYIPASGYVDPMFSMSAFISVTGESGYTPCEIDYTERPDVILYAKNKGATVETTFINMTKETLTLGDFEVKAFSIDDGEKWSNKTSKITSAKDFAKLLAKGMTLAIADGYDSKTKKPADSATVLKFSKIEKQASKPKLKVDYLTYRDDTGATNGQFAIADKTGAVLAASEIRELEIGVLAGKGKNLDENGYGLWPETGGVSISGLLNGKPQKREYLVRTMATETSIASKPAKLKVAGVLKAPSVKVDYKTETIKLKEGMTVYCNGQLVVRDVAKEDTKTPLSISEYLSSEDRIQIKIVMNATAKKGASAPQRILAAKRAEAATGGAVTLTKGKLKLNKAYEAYDAQKDKWGGLPKISGNDTILIRKKATAKPGKESDTTYAASDAMKLIVTWGTDTKGKECVTAFDVQNIP